MDGAGGVACVHVKASSHLTWHACGVDHGGSSPTWLTTAEVFLVDDWIACMAAGIYDRLHCS